MYCEIVVPHPGYLKCPAFLDAHPPHRLLDEIGYYQTPVWGPVRPFAVYRLFARLRF
jgi:hypothetical protein